MFDLMRTYKVTKKIGKALLGQDVDLGLLRKTTSSGQTCDVTLSVQHLEDCPRKSVSHRRLDHHVPLQMLINMANAWCPSPAPLP